MEQILWELWNGNVAPGPNCGVGDPRIENITVLAERNRESLLKTLSAAQRELLEKYTDCMDEFCELMTMRAFSDGFCLSTKLLTEALLKEY